MKRDAYVFSSVRARVWEKGLLTQADLTRAMDAENLERALQALQDTVYGPHIQKLDRPEDYEKALSAVLSHYYQSVIEVSPNKDLTRILSLRYDFHNLKVYTKSKILGQDLTHLYMPMGQIDEARLASFNPEMPDRGDPIQVILAQAFQAYEASQDPQDIDLVLDQAYYKLLLQVGAQAGEDFFLAYVKDQIDFYNAKALLRLNRKGTQRSELEKILAEGGAVPVEALLSSVGEEPEAIVNRFKSSRIFKALEAGLAAHNRSGRLSDFEIAEDNAYIQMAKDQQSTVYGPEVLIAFLITAESEVKNLRMILIARTNGLPKEALEGRLRNA